MITNVVSAVEGLTLDNEHSKSIVYVEKEVKEDVDKEEKEYVDKEVKEDVKKGSDINLLLHVERENKFYKDKLSRYHLSDITNVSIEFLLNELKYLPDDGVILAPGYILENKSVELQLCVTGKVKYFEFAQEAITREIAEELGFYFDHKKIKYKKMTGHNNNTYYSLIELTPHNLINNIPENGNKDYISKRIISWVYVRESNINLLLKRNRINSDDDAGEIIVGIRKRDMKDILLKWKSNKITYIDKHTFDLY